MIKHVRIFIDACMVILMVLLFPTAENRSLHIFLGLVLAAAIVIHLLLNRKWLLNSFKNLFGGKVLSEKSQSNMYTLMRQIFLVNRTLYDEMIKNNLLYDEELGYGFQLPSLEPTKSAV